MEAMNLESQSLEMLYQVVLTNHLPPHIKHCSLIVSQP